MKSYKFIPALFVPKNKNAFQHATFKPWCMPVQQALSDKSFGVLV